MEGRGERFEEGFGACFQGESERAKLSGRGPGNGCTLKKSAEVEIRTFFEDCGELGLSYDTQDLEIEVFEVDLQL